MKIGKYNIIVDWKSGYFWITVIIFLIVSALVAGWQGLLASVLVSLLPIFIYLVYPLFGQYMGPMGGAGWRPNYPTPEWLVRFFAWITLMFFAILTIYEMIKNPF